MLLRSLIVILLSTIILGQIHIFAVGPIIYTTPPIPGYTRLCSVASRGTSTQTIESLYNLNALQKAYITKVNPSVNFTDTIVGALSRHHNKQAIASNPNCNLTGTIGAREGDEISQWSIFWGQQSNTYKSLFSGANPSYINEISPVQAANLQSYIDRSCGFNLQEDGKIGIKTLNASFVCTPPCQGKCGRSQFIGLKDKLFYDKEGTKPVYTNDAFSNDGNPATSAMYIDGSTLSAVPDGLDPYLMLSGGKVVAKDTGSVADMIAKKGLGLTTTVGAIEEDICPLEEEEKAAVNNLDIGMSAAPLIVSAGLACYIDNLIDKDGNVLSSDQVKTKVKDALVNSNSTIDPASIDKLKNKDGTSSGSPTGAEGGCSLQGDGAITANGACQCAPNYKRVWTLDGEKCEVCDPVKCNCGLKLNTNMPFIGRCIRYGDTNTIGDASIIGTGEGADQTIVVNQLNAFPVLVSGLIKILMVLLGLLNFFMLIVGGVQMTIEGSYDDGWKKVQGVAIGLAVFGALGVVLYLINPNFFT